MSYREPKSESSDNGNSFVSVFFTYRHCDKCGIPFGFPAHAISLKRIDMTDGGVVKLYCPNGHVARYRRPEPPTPPLSDRERAELGRLKHENVTPHQQIEQLEAAKRERDELRQAAAIAASSASHFTFRLVRGRMVFDGVPVDDILDTDERSYTQVSHLSRETSIRLAFFAGWIAAKLAERSRQRPT